MLWPIESYTKFDLANNTHCGLCKYTRLPFGITTAPSLWQQAIAQVLSGIPNVAYYIDTNLITGRTRSEHIENLQMVLCGLREYGLKLKHSKCKFFANDQEFLGHLLKHV